MIFAVGFDEEGGADMGQGARCLAERLLEDYGEDGIELIVGLTFALELESGTRRGRMLIRCLYSSTKESRASDPISDLSSLSSPQQKKVISTLP